jgi:hypothetical protein
MELIELSKIERYIPASSDALTAEFRRSYI